MATVLPAATERRATGLRAARDLVLHLHRLDREQPARPATTVAAGDRHATTTSRAASPSTSTGPPARAASRSAAAEHLLAPGRAPRPRCDAAFSVTVQSRARPLDRDQPAAAAVVEPSEAGAPARSSPHAQAPDGVDRRVARSAARGRSSVDRPASRRLVAPRLSVHAARAPGWPAGSARSPGSGGALPRAAEAAGAASSRERARALAPSLFDEAGVVVAGRRTRGSSSSSAKERQVGLDAADANSATRRAAGRRPAARSSP